MLPQKNFENLHTVVAILALLKQFLGDFQANHHCRNFRFRIVFFISKCNKTCMVSHICNSL